MSDPDDFRGRRRHWHVRSRCLCGDDGPEDMEEIEDADKGVIGENGSWTWRQGWLRARKAGVRIVRVVVTVEG